MFNYENLCDKKILLCGPIHMSLVLLVGAEPEFVYRLDYRGALKILGWHTKKMNSAWAQHVTMGNVRDI